MAILLPACQNEGKRGDRQASFLLKKESLWHTRMPLLQIPDKISFPSHRNGATLGNLPSGFCNKKSAWAFVRKKTTEYAEALRASTAWFSLDFLLQKPGKFPSGAIFCFFFLKKEERESLGATTISPPKNIPGNNDLSLHKKNALQSARRSHQYKNFV